MKKALVLSLAVILAACSDATAPIPDATPQPGGRRPAAGAADPILVYQANFNVGTVGGEWSSNKLSLTPTGERFLGDFLNEQVGLLVIMPPHSQIVIEADVYFIRTWDGTDTQWGPDTFNMGVDATPLLNTTISTVNANQNYPYSVGGLEVSAGTGALASNTLGYTYWAELVPEDATYRFSYTVNHTSPVAFIHWQASGLQYLADESWGLDNIRISYNP